MSHAVEILVTDETEALSLASAIGVRDTAVRFRTQPSTGSAARIFISWLATLESFEGRVRAERLLLAGLKNAKETVLVFLAADATARVTFSLAATQALALLSARTSPKFDAYVAPDSAAVRRLIQARRFGATKELIASASL